jgi:hypothetical protein
MSTVVYVVGDNDSTEYAKMTRVCEARRAAEAQATDLTLPQAPPSATAARGVRAPRAAQVDVARLSEIGTKVQLSPDIAVVLLRKDFPRPFVIDCRRRAARVELSSVAVEMRRWSIEDETTALICDRCAPREPSDLLPRSRVWYSRLLEHIRQASTSSLLVMVGRVGCGKTCLVELAGRHAGVVLTRVSDAEGDEEVLWDKVVGATMVARRDKRISLVVIDNADGLKQPKLAAAAFARIVRLPSRVALVAIVNNWFERDGLMAALRAHSEKRPQPARKKKAIADAATGVGKKRSPPAPFEGLKVVKFECKPDHTASEIASLLERCLPKRFERVVFATIAAECNGDVRVAMQRAEMLARLPTRGVVTVDEQMRSDAFTIDSPARQLSNAVREMREKQRREKNCFLPIERRFQTLDQAAIAEEMMFANYPNAVSFGPTSLPEFDSLKKPGELETALVPLEMTCDLLESLSDADRLRTLEQRSSYKGASNNVTLAFGVGIPAALLTMAAPKRHHNFTMDFTRLTNITKTRTNSAVLATLDPLIRICEALNSSTNDLQRVYTTNLKSGLLTPTSSAVAFSLERFERVLSVGRYISRERCSNDVLRRRQAIELSKSGIALLGRLKACGWPEMMQNYEQEQRELARYRDAAMVCAKTGPSTVDALKLAALRAGALGLNEREFAIAVAFADSFRRCIDLGDKGALKKAPEADEERAVKELAVSMFRSIKNDYRKMLEKRPRVDLDEPMLTTGKRRFAVPKASRSRAATAAAEDKTVADDDDDAAAPDADAEDDVVENGI